MESTATSNGLILQKSRSQIIEHLKMDTFLTIAQGNAWPTRHMLCDRALASQILFSNPLSHAFPSHESFRDYITSAPLLDSLQVLPFQSLKPL